MLSEIEEKVLKHLQEEKDPIIMKIWSDILKNIVTIEAIKIENELKSN